METEKVKQVSKVIYTGKTRTTGGREHGHARSSDGNLDIKLTTPGTKGPGTNPEQLFAAGWSACFEGALGIGARRKQINLPDETAIDAEVDLVSGSEGAFLQARLYIDIPGLERDIAQELVDFAKSSCPYSKAVSGNVNVEYNLV